MRIGRISKTRQGRFALFDEDGAFLFSVDDETLIKNRLKEGAALDAASLSALKEQSDLRKAKDKALSLLSLRDHAGGELYEKLCRSFDEHTAAAAVAEMRRLELLDDARFARHRAIYLAGQNKSAREIRRRLLEKGVDRATADAAVAALDTDETAACRAVIEKSYLRKLQAGRRDLVIAALARRGFSYGVIKAALEAVQADAADALNDPDAEGEICAMDEPDAQDAAAGADGTMDGEEGWE